MVNFCKTQPDKGVNLFNNLKKHYGYNVAFRVWGLATIDSFKEGKNFRLDSEGFPLFEDFIKDPVVQEGIGKAKIMQSLEKNFEILPDTRDNYSDLVYQANTFNRNPENIDYIAIVNNNDGNLKVSISPRTDSNEVVANNQYSVIALNNKLADELSKIGITIDDITDAEQRAGRIGVTDFTQAKNLANDCVSVIRIANNHEGTKALGEEFSHLVIGAFHDEPLIKRALATLDNEEVLRGILGDEYNSVYDFQDGDLELVAEEALGKLLREHLLSEVSGTSEKISYILNRLFANIRNKFKKLDADRIINAIIDADSSMGLLAKNILKGQANLTRKKIALAERMVQFNALSDLIKTNIQVLKNLKATEVKRVKISRRNPKDVQEIKKRIKRLSAFTSGEKDTRIGIYNYANEALEKLRDIESIMIGRSITGTPSAGVLRLARSYIQSYTPFIEDMQKAIIKAETDDEVPDFLTDIELEDGTVVSMADVIKELNNLIKTMAVRYNEAAKQLVIDFFRPFFGNDITITAGKHRGEKLSLEAIVSEAQSDISFTNTLLDTMADCQDPFLKLFDVAAKQANDNARTATIDTSNEITRIRLDAERNGIRNFDWMYERNSKGKKTGNYISEFNIGLYQEKRQEFLDYLEAKYGENPSREEVRQKYNELKAWNLENADPDDVSLPKQIERWLNKDFADSMADPAKKQVYDRVMSIKWQADRKYPDNRVSDYKAIQRRKSSGNRIIESVTNPASLITNIKEAMRETFLEAQDDDQLFGESKSALTNFDGTEYMALPVLYTNRLKNPEDLSNDIFSDLLVYTHAANTYKEMDKIIDSLEVARSLVTDGVRKVQATEGGNPLKEKIKAFGETVSNKVYKGNTNIERRLNAWMEAVPYQKHAKDEGAIDIPFIGRLSKTKVGNWLMSVTSMTSLGFNYLANSANVVTGTAMLNIEAFAGEYFNKRDITSAIGTYNSNLLSFVSELGSRNKTNFLSLFDEFFNIQAEYGNNIKENQKRNVFEKIFGNNLAYLLDRCGNHFLYNAAALAYARHMRVLVPKVVKVVEKVTGFKGAVETVNRIIENSSYMQLTPDETMYENTLNGKLSARVTTVIRDQDKNEISEAWKTPSTNIGTGIDELVRDFFSGLLVKTTDGKWHHDNKGDELEVIYPNIRTEDINAFLNQLVELKELFDKKGLTVVSRNVVARGSIKINDNGTIRDLSVAGTLDLLAYDKNGNFHIFDMKTHRSKNINNAKRYAWSKQLSLYKRFLEQEYGINVKSINAIPIKVYYPTPKGEMSGDEEGTAEYSVIEGTNQLIMDGSEFKRAKPERDQIIELSVVDKIPVEYDNLGYNKQNAKIENTDGYQEMSLLEALEVVNAYKGREDIKKMVLPEGTLDKNGVPVSKDRISRDMQEMVIHLFGAYNEEDVVAANQYVLGRMLIQFRKWMMPQFNKRFKPAEISFISGKTQEGYYRTFGKFIARKCLYNLMNEALRSKVQIPGQWSELSNEEKANVKRAVTELVQFFLVAMIAAYAPWPDDKERPWAMKYLEYMMQRERHELGMLAPSPMMLQELQKTVTDPAAVLSTTGKFVNLVNSMFSPEDWIDEKQSGPYKGMSTLEANFLRAPLFGVSQYRQIDRFLNDLDTSINFYARPTR